METTNNNQSEKVANKKPEVDKEVIKQKIAEKEKIVSDKKVVNK